MDQGSVQTISWPVQGAISFQDVNFSYIDHEIVLKDKGGALVVCSLNSVLVKDAEGRTLKIIGSLRNVTDRKNAEQKLLTYRDRLEDLVKERTTDLVEVNASLRKEIDQRRQVEDAKQKLERQLQQAQRMKAIGTLAGGIAHDFNNLLMGIQGNLSLLMLRVAEHEPKYEYLTAIERCVESGANLTRQLLGYARGGKYVVAQINLNDTIRRTIGLFGRTKKEVNIHARYQEDLWPDTVSIWTRNERIKYSGKGFPMTFSKTCINLCQKNLS